MVCHIFIKEDLNILPSALGPVKNLKAFLAMEDSLLCLTLLEPFTWKNNKIFNQSLLHCKLCKLFPFFFLSFRLIKALALLSFMVLGVSPCSIPTLETWPVYMLTQWHHEILWVWITAWNTSNGLI